MVHYDIWSALCKTNITNLVDQRLLVKQADKKIKRQKKLYKQYCIDYFSWFIVTKLMCLVWKLYLHVYDVKLRNHYEFPTKYGKSKQIDTSWIK